MAKQKTLLIYQSYLCQIGGVETFLYNFCYNLRDYYDITVLYCAGDNLQIKRLKKLVKLEKFEKEKTYECDIFLRNSVWGEIPNNVISKDNRYLEMRHADYKWLLERKVLHQQYFEFDKTNEVIACGENVGRISDEILHDNPTVIKNILLPKQKINKVLRLISCTRIDSEKGWDRMLKMADMMRKANIKFEWKIFTNSPQNCDYEEIHFYKPRFDIWDYLVDSHYCVLLSNREGFPYTPQEALQYQVPCIVTDIPGCTEMVKDGINGYVVPLDMNFDINKILNIPKCPEYDNHALEKWLDYLGDSYYIKKEEIQEMKYLVEALDAYEKGNVTDSVLGYIPKAGEQFEVDKDRLEVLLGDNEHNTVFVKIVPDREPRSDFGKQVKELTECSNGFTFEIDDVNEYQEGAIEKVTEELSLKEKNKPSTKKATKKK